MNNIFLGLKIIATVIVFVILSWLLVHVLAVFGVFLAVAYPLWWLFAPQKTVCLLCRAKPEGTICPFCRRQVVKKGGISPLNLRSAILNGALIFIFSLISVGVVYGESQVLFKLGFPPTAKTASFIIPPKGQYRLGEIFPMRIDIDNMENPINAVQADVGFDSDKIEVVSISEKDSFANIFIQKEINNEAGWARLTGGLPNPGWFGDHGTFGTIYFKGKSPGLVKISFLASSIVLANDGRGTNILKDLPSVSYLILPERISNEEEKEQQKLISNSNVLGATSGENEKLIFYDESAVLGAQSNTEIQEEQTYNPSSFLLGVIETTDRFILDFWHNIFDKVL